LAYDDEFTTLRRRLDVLEQEADRRARDGLGGMNRTLVGRVFDGGAMPTTVPGFFKVRPVTLDGTEAIGEPVTITDSAWDEAVVLVLGSEVPDVGDVLVARLIGGYWVAQRGGGEEEAATVLFDGVFSCGGGCLIGGATVTVTQATLGVSEVGTTDANGDCTIAVPCNTSATFSYSIAGAGYTTKTGAFTLSAGPPCTATVSGAGVELLSSSAYFCHGSSGAICHDPIPASLFVTFPTHVMFGNLSGTTQSVAFAALSGSNAIWRSCFAAVGSCIGASLGVEVRINGAIICGAATASVRIYQDTPGIPGCDAFPGTGSSYLANVHAGTIACPVAFTSTNGTFTYGGGACPVANVSGIQCTVSE
jgi:hypothetical protein